MFELYQTRLYPTTVHRYITAQFLHHASTSCPGNISTSSSTKSSAFCTGSRRRTNKAFPRAWGSSAPASASPRRWM